MSKAVITLEDKPGPLGPELEARISVEGEGGVAEIAAGAFIAWLKETYAALNPESV